MTKNRRRFSPGYKFRVALEVAKGQQTLSELLGLNRSSPYYEAVGESAENLHLVRLLDEQYLRTPFYGWPRMTAYLRRESYCGERQTGQAIDAEDGVTDDLS